MTTIQIVYVCNREICSEIFTTTDPLAAMEIRGFKWNGKVAGAPLRVELHDMPKFSDLCGPMWGGDGVVRYETAEAYREMAS